MLRPARASLLCLLLAGLTLGGCVSDGGPTAASNAFASTGAVTVAFESVDGPPPQVFDRLVDALDSEAKLRGVPVVSREGAATYRVRSYLSAQVRGKRTTIAWVWDVYDGSQQRALRLTGEEIATRSGADAWAAADDTVLRRIAQAGLTGLNGVLGGRSAPSSPRASGPAIADNSSGQQVPDALGFNPR
jgi:hypothetical protein